MKGNNGNSNYLKIIKMMNSNEKMQCPKIYRALSIIPLTNLDFERNIPIIYSFSFFSFRSGKELLEEICRHVREN